MGSTRLSEEWPSAARGERLHASAWRQERSGVSLQTPAGRLLYIPLCDHQCRCNHTGCYAFHTFQNKTNPILHLYLLFSLWILCSDWLISIYLEILTCRTKWRVIKLWRNWNSERDTETLTADKSWLHDNLQPVIGWLHHQTANQLWAGWTLTASFCPFLSLSHTHTHTQQEPWWTWIQVRGGSPVWGFRVGPYRIEHLWLYYYTLKNSTKLNECDSRGILNRMWINNQWQVWLQLSRISSELTLPPLRLWQKFGARWLDISVTHTVKALLWLGGLCWSWCCWHHILFLQMSKVTHRF